MRSRVASSTIVRPEVSRSSSGRSGWARCSRTIASTSGSTERATTFEGSWLPPRILGSPGSLRWSRDVRGVAVRRTPSMASRHRHGDESRRRRGGRRRPIAARSVDLGGRSDPRRAAPAGDRPAHGRGQPAPVTDQGGDRRDRPGRVHGPTRGAGDGEGAGARAGRPDRGDLDCRGTPRGIGCRTDRRAAPARRPERPHRDAPGWSAGPARGRDRARSRARRDARRRRSRRSGARRRHRARRPGSGRLRGRAPPTGRRPPQPDWWRRPRATRPGVRQPAARRDTRDRGGGMVARPPVKLTIEPMRLEDLEEVQRIELASFSTPWPENAYRSELMTNRLASYLVARIEGRIIAYGGMWLMVDEAHITTFAVHPACGRATTATTTRMP